MIFDECGSARLHDEVREVTADKTKGARDAFVAALLSNPEKYRKQWDAEARREQTDLTEEQLDQSWKQLADQFGL